MATKQLSQTEALKMILSKGRPPQRFTLDQLVELVWKKTKRTVTRSSLIVRLSELRSDGWEIQTFRGKASRSKDGSAQYQLA